MNTYSGIVLSNSYASDRYYHLTLRSEVLASTVKEGQIIHIKCGDDSSNLLLRRPFSVYRFHKDTGVIEFLYLVKGKGTEYMTKLKAGDQVDLLGPTGNFYEIHENVKSIAVIGRGVGIASIVSIAEKARAENMHVTAVLSGRNPDAVVSKELLSHIGCKVIPVNDEDGSSSIDHVKTLLSQSIEENKIEQLFICGSKRMGLMVKDLSDQYNIPAYISLEEHMACGIGVCKGCVCKTKEGYKTVCHEGPIFPISEVEL